MKQRRTKKAIAAVAEVAAGSPPVSQPVIKIIRRGDTTKPNPFTICIAANPALEAPWGSNAFAADPISANQVAFDAAVQYVDTALFGALPNQREQFINDPTVAAKIRVVSIFVQGLSLSDSNALVAQDGVSNILVARRTAFTPFLARYGLYADVAYAVSGSKSHTRASAWFTSDDDSRGGVNFTLDGASLSHRYHNLIPGTVAIHTSSNSLTALHEFGHALSSYSNGSVVDLYVDSGVGLNNKLGRPIPPAFGTYNAVAFNSDSVRDGLGYPPGWQSYHSELIDANVPAVMDDYWQAATHVPEHCQHDKITRQFLLDRLQAKVARP